MMIYFITSHDGVDCVENAMKHINNYISYGNNSLHMVLGQNDFLEHELEKLLVLAEKVSKDYEKMLSGTIESEGRFAKVKSFLKRMFRKCMKWYIKDVVSDQAALNYQLICCLKQQLAINKSRLLDNEE